MAAALNYAGMAAEADYLRRFQALPSRHKWLLYCPQGEEIVLAVASGAQPCVLERALKSVTAEFAPAKQVELSPQAEPRRLVWLFRLRRYRLVPSWLALFIGQRLWQSFSGQEGSRG